MLNYYRLYAFTYLICLLLVKGRVSTFFISERHLLSVMHSSIMQCEDGNAALKNTMQIQTGWEHEDLKRPSPALIRYSFSLVWL